MYREQIQLGQGVRLLFLNSCVGATLNSIHVIHQHACRRLLFACSLTLSIMSISINGSILEGGGQILRNSVALAALLGKPISIHKIRNGRKPPGLKNQHRTGSFLPFFIILN